jgi:hypothetical protein
MVPAAEKAAEKLIAGGTLYVAGNPGFGDEMEGRAGGFPFTRILRSEIPGGGDVVLVGHYRPDGSDFDYDLFDPLSRRQTFGEGMVVHLGSHDWPHLKSAVVRAASRPGNEALYLFDTRAGKGESWQAQCLGQVATTALAWAFQGEVMSAATRKGKTLATYASDWEPGGPDWDDTVRHEHLHPTYRVPAIPAGKVGSDYLRICRKQVEQFVSTQSGQVRQAAARMAQSMRRGGTVWIVTNSHIHPRGSPVPEALPAMTMCGREGAWHGVAGGMQAPDVLLWLGYLRYPTDEISEAVARGQAVVLCADDGPNDSRRVNIRACWKDYDTVIDLPKYPIRVLPSTGTVGCAQWYCIMAETVAAYKTRR